MNLFKLTWQELRLDLEAVIDYAWADEVEDFEQQLFEENADGDHVFIKLHRLANVLRVLNGETPLSLGEHLWDELLKPATYYMCDNCKHIDSKLDPIPPDYWQYMEGGEIAPAGFCTRCGAAAFPV